MTVAALALAAAAGAAVLLAGPTSRLPGAGASSGPFPPGRHRAGAVPLRRLALGTAAAVFAAGAVAGSPLFMGPATVATAASGWLADAAAVRRRARRRQAEVTALVDGLGRSVRSGATLPVALAEADRLGGTSQLDPELRHVRADLAAGRPFATALDDWSRRSADPDLRLLAGTVAVLAAAGGSAGPALDAVARTLRARVAAAADVRALASQATASAVVLVAAPAAFAVVLATVDPRLGRFLVDHPAGAACVSVALALDAAGLWWMQRIIDGGTR